MSVEWSAPAIILSIRPHGDADALATLLTEAHGRHPGLAKGGQSRKQVGLWQPGNLIEARWIARLAEQLGAYTAEMVHAAAALAMEDALSLGILTSGCAVADGALPERQPHPASFRALLATIKALAGSVEVAMPCYIAFEATLLAELGYGLDLERCAVTGTRDNLSHVSPKSGRAVSAEAAAPYAQRLFPLPPFMRGEAQPITPEHWLQALAITGHFLARDAFHAHDRPLPDARERLQTRVAGLVDAAPSA
jgi:DNA repair protein RecO (recombination protein O)